MKKKTLLVLAAGMGSRYGGLKQIDPVGPNGEIILDYSIYDALKAGFDKVVFIIRRDIEHDFREAVGRHWEKRADIRYAFQNLADLPDPYTVPADRVKPWGTGHAVLCARPEIEEPFAVINADDFYGASGYASLADSLNQNRPSAGPLRFHMVGFELNRTLSPNGTVSRGVCSEEQGMLTGIVERTGIARTADGSSVTDSTGFRMTGGETVSMNLWGFTPEFFDLAEPLFRKFLDQSGKELKSEFYLPSAVFGMVRAGQAVVEVLHSADSWFGVTYREDKPRVVESIRLLSAAGKYPAALF